MKNRTHKATTDPHPDALSVRAAYVKAARERAVAAGARMIPRGLLHKPAADALALLRAAGYAGSLTAVIERALVDAADRLPRPTRKTSSKTGPHQSGRGTK